MVMPSEQPAEIIFGPARVFGVTRKVVIAGLLGGAIEAAKKRQKP